ncbi:hypothetical protein ABZ413_33675 [Nocardia rhamnosiphila]|uniref:hypothetical protein n=1 Tax=Nocardia rhamnosiphila TaxID=426716 RepID=UPI0033E35351
MSDNTNGQPSTAPADRSSTPRRGAPTPEGARQLLSALRELRRIGALPHDMRTGPITADYGARAFDDARHAARLREVQNLAAVRFQASETGTGRATLRQLNLSELDTALKQSRDLARSAGLRHEEVAAAEAAGATGTTWMAGPSHRWLGRIEQLTDELEQVKQSLNLQKNQLASMVERVATAESTIARQAEELAHTDNYIRTIWDTLSSAEWELGQTLTVQPELPAASTPRIELLSTAEPTDRDADTRGPGSAIDSAIDSALPEGVHEPWKPDRTPPPDPSPDGDTDRGTGADA